MIDNVCISFWQSRVVSIFLGSSRFSKLFFVFVVLLPAGKIKQSSLLIRGDFFLLTFVLFAVYGAIAGQWIAQCDNIILCNICPFVGKQQINRVY